MKVFIVTYKDIKLNCIVDKQFLDEKRANKFIQEIQADGKNKIFIKSGYQQV